MSKEALSRLKKEYESIQRESIPNAIAVPDPKNWLRWHYTVFDLDGPFLGGVYYGELKFPMNYPMGPPSIIMHTPNGRFIPDKKICTSMSDYHPESWSPIWKVSTIITGLISFMQDNEQSTGCEVTSNSHKASLAKQSLEWNLRNQSFNEIFQDYLEQIRPKPKPKEDQVDPVNAQQDNKSYRILAIAVVIVIIAYLVKM